MNKLEIEKTISVKVNYIYNLAYQLLLLVVPLITTPYVSRVLEADGIGAYSYTTSIVTYFTMFGSLGIATYGQLKIAAERNNEKARSLLFWEILFARLVTMVLSITVYCCFYLINNQYRTLYTILLVNIIAAAIDITWFLQGLEQFKKIVTRNCIIKILSVILIFVFVNEKDDLYKYALILQGSTLIGNLSLWLYSKNYLIKVKFKELKIYKHWKPCFVYFIPTVATSVYTILDKSMLGWITNSPYENGYYEQAQRIQQVAVTIVTSLSTVSMPRIVSLFKEKRDAEIEKMINNTMRFVLCVSIPMTFGLIGIADNLIPWFLGKGYDKCIILLRISSFLIILIGLNNTIGKQCLMPMGMQNRFNKGVIIGAIVNLVVNLILMPKISSLGGMIASVCAEAIILGIFIYYSREFINMKILVSVSANYTLSAVIMCGIIYLIGVFTNISTQTIILQIAIGITAYFGFLLILKDQFILLALNKFMEKIGNKDYKK